MMLAAAALALCVWLVLLFGRAGFWRLADRDDGPLAPPGEGAIWPAVVAVVPARNEADVIATTLSSLVAQAYPGPFRIILVDDQSDDGTAATARKAAGDKVQLIDGSPRPPGWTGKLWALEQGIRAAGTPDWLWLTDADIGHAPGTLTRLVARALAGRLAMVSLMAKLHCKTPAERALIPAFIYFFAMLFPFARVNRPDDPLAAAAGGCVLIRRDVLAQAGGIAAIRSEIIDDCALAAAIKPHGPIWLGLSDTTTSLRPYGFGDIRRMVARSAYAQLGYSPLRLLGTLVAMPLIFALPPVLALAAGGWAQFAGALAWGLMTVSILPVLRYYRQSALWALALPLVALTYAGFTLDSAVQHWRGRGGLWKGRAQAMGRA